MITANAEVMAPAAIGQPSPSPWAGGQLPSPWAVPPSTNPAGITPPSAPPVPSAQIPFSQAVEQARQSMSSSPAALQAVMPPGAIADLGLGQHFGFPSIETMGKRLSKAGADMARNIEGLSQLDPNAPDTTAQILGVTLMSAKTGVVETIALKFASKVNESINTLMKTN